MPLCSRFNAILLNSSDTNRGLLVRSRCKQWDCSYCAKMNKKAWRYELYIYLQKNPDLVWSFHTFTFHFRKNHNRHQRLIMSVNRIKTRWDTLMKRLKRRYGKFEYVRILEPHKLGGYHIHLMASFRIPEKDIAYRYDKLQKRKTPYLKWLKNDLVKLKFGYIQHSENAIGNGAQTVSYITKYMTKDDGQQYDRIKDNKIRYVQTSRGIKSPFNKPKNELSEWELKHFLHYDDFIETAIWHDLNKKKDITLDDLYDAGGHYPDYDADKSE